MIESSTSGMADLLSDFAFTDDLVIQAAERMKPFVNHIENGTYDLSRVIDHGRAASALEGATGRKVTRTKLLSLSDVHEKYGNVGKEVWREIRGHHHPTLAESLSGAPVQHFRKHVQTRIPPAFWEEIERSFMDPLWSRFIVTLGMDIDKEMADDFWKGIKAGLMFFLGFSLAGEEEWATRFTGLIELLPTAVPWATKGDEGTVWTLISA